MRFAAVLLPALLALPLCAGNQQEDVNVNSRYIVESVHVTGKPALQLSQDLRKDVESVIGQNLDHGVLDRLASRLKRELRVERVDVRVDRGRVPDHVSVEFQVEDGGRKRFDLDVTKFAYHSRQGWTGAGEGRAHFGENTLALGLVSDGDELVERFAGLRTRWERRSLGTSRVRVALGFDTYHQQWNRSTISAAQSAGLSSELYRSRNSLQPSMSIALSDPVTLSFGANFQQLEPQLPGARTVSSNTANVTLSAHRTWQDDASTTHALDAAYRLRAATALLASDYIYVRHEGDVRYQAVNGRHGLTVDFTAGTIGGHAPMYERFVLGTASTLRGWSKFDLAPLGGDRAVHGSVDYRYRVFTVFYDSGVVWTGTTSTGPKHSAGVGFRTDGREGLLIAVAFPFRAGHFDPMFIMGFNF